MSRTHADEAIAEALHLIERANEARLILLASKWGPDYYRVRSWYRSGRVTIAVEGYIGTDRIVYFGRGSSISAALEHLGAWDAF